MSDLQRILFCFGFVGLIRWAFYAAGVGWAGPPRGLYVTGCLMLASLVLWWLTRPEGK